MLIVSDTTPVISLVKIGLLGLFTKLYSEIILPEAVFYELINNPQMSNEAEIIKKSNFLTVKKIEDVFAVTALQKQFNLGAGESEAIVLADTLKVDLLVIDEKKARGIARSMGINITGTLGLLVDAKRQNRVKKLKPLLDKLIDSNIRISEKLYNDILELVDEKE